LAFPAVKHTTTLWFTTFWISDLRSLLLYVPYVILMLLCVRCVILILDFIDFVWNFRLAVNKKGAPAKARKPAGKGKAAKDPNKPKRPPSAFFVFM